MTHCRLECGVCENYLVMETDLRVMERFFFVYADIIPMISLKRTYF